MRTTSILLFGALVTTSAHAATINVVNPVGTNGNWSNGALWQGGVAPGPNDYATCGNLAQLTIDAAASSVIGTLDGTGTKVWFTKDTTFTNVYLREGFFYDGGHDITVTGVLGNGVSGAWNGGALVREGGVYDIGTLDLGRAAGAMAFRPGDMIRQSVLTHTTFNVWPDISVTQDPGEFGANLGQGLTLDNPVATFSLGTTSPTNRSELTLTWDDDFTGPIDWTLRWRGDHAADLRLMYANLQILIGPTPTIAAPFDATSNIFYDAATDFTYIGFRAQDIPGYRDGICQPQDSEDLDADGYADDCEPLGFSGLLPGRVGVNGYVVWDAAPGASVRLLRGESLGSVEVPGCPGVYADIASPHVLEAMTIGADGLEASKIRVPEVASGRTVYVQALDRSTCRLSEVFEFTP